jgi:hypothetical protein
MQLPAKSRAIFTYDFREEGSPTNCRDISQHLFAGVRVPHQNSLKRLRSISGSKNRGRRDRQGQGGMAGDQCTEARRNSGAIPNGRITSRSTSTSTAIMARAWGPAPDRMDRRGRTTDRAFRTSRSAALSRYRQIRRLCEGCIRGLESASGTLVCEFDFSSDKGQ